ELFRYNGKERDPPVSRTCQKNRPLDSGLERIANGLKQFSIGILYFGNDVAFRRMQCRKFVRDLSRATLQLCLARLCPFLFPFPNINLELFEMRCARVDSFEHCASLGFLFK